ncbi:MAG TPA: superoxide dismutase [Cu-Zn] SodC [Methylophilaceae bacterium]|nr:superoxide dismutase [Cu-Zn] SodC [Methylophilaceae bacterium]
MRTRSLLLAVLFSITVPAMAAEKIVVINLINESGIGKPIGTIKLSDSATGLVLDPDLGELPPGPHGFHIHENPSCAPGEKDGKKGAGLAAGGHFDPEQSSKHEGPGGHGHHGDLPLLVVKPDGSMTQPLTAPRLKVEQLTGRSIMIHEGGDNYRDTPKPLGGGGGRIACGVIE